MLLGACQGIVGHSKDDFDTGSYMSDTFMYVTYVLLDSISLNPISPFAVQSQSIQDRKKWLVIWAGSYPQYTRGNHFYTLSWLLSSSIRINLPGLDDNPFENNIVNNGSLL
jgi:hypothetical protein